MKPTHFIVAFTLSSVSWSAQALVTDPPPITNQDVEPGLLQIVQEQLPEASAVDASFLNTDYDAYLTLNQDANVSITFLDEGAGYRNSLGWFTFSGNTFNNLSRGDIDNDDSGTVSLTELNAVEGVTTGWLFPNISESGGGGSLLAGDTVPVGDGLLPSGTSISFLLAQNAWAGRDRVSNGVLNGERQIFYGLDFLNPEADATSTIDSSLINSRHVALLFADDSQEEVIMGFEDLNRIDRYSNDWNFNSDEDFNDAVFIVNSDPASAFGDSNIATAPIPPMGTGLIGILMLGVLGCVYGSPGRENATQNTTDHS